MPTPAAVAHAPRRRTSTARRRVRAVVWRARLVLVALGCGLIAATVVDRVSPAPPVTRAVVVSARAIDAGTVLAEEDLSVVHVAAGLTPEDSLTQVSDAVGRTTSVALPRGLPLAPSLVAAGDLAAAAPAGTVVAPVRLTDPSVSALLHPGDRVDLFAATENATDPGAGNHVARRALVLAGAPAEPAGGGLLGGGGTHEGRITLVAVLPDEAAALARVGEWGGLSVALVP